MLPLFSEHPQLFFSACSVVSSLFLFILVLFRYRNRGSIAFAAVSLSMCVWQAGKFLKNSPLAFPETAFVGDLELWSRVSFIGAAFIYPAFFDMCTRLSLRRQGGFKALLFLGYASALIFVLLDYVGVLTHGSRLTPYGYYHRPGDAYWIFLATFSLYMGLSLRLLYPANLPNVPHLKNQAIAVFWGATAGFGLGGLEFVGVLWQPLYPLSDFSPCLFGGIVYWAIYRFNIIGGGDILKSVLIRLGYLFLLFVLVYTVYYAIGALVQKTPIPETDAVYIVLYTLVFFALTPAYIFLLRWVRRTFFPVRYSYRQIYTTLSQGLNKKRTTAEMFETALNLMEQEFNYSGGQAYVFLLSGEGTDRRRFQMVGRETPPKLPPEFFSRREFDTILSRSQTLNSLRLGNAQSEDSQSLAFKTLRVLNRLQADLVIPVQTEGMLLGLLCFNQRRNRPEPWQVVDDILTTISQLLGSHVYQLFLLKTQADKEHLSHVGMMAATLAHEIKNPLEGIYGAAQIVKESEPGQKKFVDIILKDAVRLNDIVKRFLQFSNPFETSLNTVDLHGCLGQFVRELNETDPGHPVSLDLSSEPLSTTCDEEGLRHVLLNLVQNAKRFQPPGSPVRLKLEKNHDHIRLAVEDDGAGVPPEQREQIFSPFYTSSSKGTGLGLAISRKIARGLGGELYYEPLKQGSRFILDLPLM